MVKPTLILDRLKLHTKAKLPVIGQLTSFITSLFQMVLALLTIVLMSLRVTGKASSLGATVSGFTMIGSVTCLTRLVRLHSAIIIKPEQAAKMSIQ